MVGNGLFSNVRLGVESCLGPVAVYGLESDNLGDSGLEENGLVVEEGLTAKIEGLVEVPHVPCRLREKELGLVGPERKEGLVFWPSISRAQGADPTRWVSSSCILRQLGKALPLLLWILGLN